jgi:hypothetical protein
VRRPRRWCPATSGSSHQRTLAFSCGPPLKTRTANGRQAASAISSSNIVEKICLLTALGCQLMGAKTSVCRCFLGSSRPAKRLSASGRYSFLFRCLYGRMSVVGQLRTSTRAIVRSALLL